MTSFAVMTVDWSSQRRSYLDNFLNYALYVVPTDPSLAISRDAIRPLIIQRFNLILPANIVEQLVRRAVKVGLLATAGNDRVSLTDKGRKEVAPIEYTLKKLAKEQVELAERFAEWSLDEIGVLFDVPKATSILLDYVETYYCSLMSLSEAGQPLRLPGIEPTPEQKVAAAFVAAMYGTEDDVFESVANMARGSMMVSALYSPALVDTTRGFRQTTLYLDTKVAFRAMGYESEAAEQSTLELLQILQRQGARIAIFDFTLREIQSVIHAVARKAQSGRLWDARPGSVDAFFYRMNASNAQIEQHSVRVEGRIAGIGVSVDSSPSYENHRFVVDEGEIEAALSAGNPNYHPEGLRHDVQLIASVVRARAGRSRNTLEESRATFITLNSLVVATARTAQYSFKEAWPLVMFESDVAALTWVKEPLAAPNLPKNQLLATSLGLTNPGKHDWGLYIGEIGKLLESDEITDNDLILLRQKYEMDRLAFVVAPGQSKDKSRRQQIRVSVEAARAAVTEQLTAPIQAEKDQVAEELRAERSEREAKSAEADRLLASILGPVWRNGALIRWGSAAALLLVAGLAVLATFVPQWEDFLERLPFGELILGAVRTIAVVAAVAGGLWGPIAKICDAARRRYILSKLQKLAVDPGRALEMGFDVLQLRRTSNGRSSSTNTE